MKVQYMQIKSKKTCVLVNIDILTMVIFLLRKSLKNEIRFKYYPTEWMLSDLFTKYSQGGLFIEV